MDKILEKQLYDSFYVHVPMQIDESRSVETVAEQKKVLHATNLWDGKDLSPWTFDGEGTAEVQDGVLIMRTGSRAEHWPDEEVRCSCLRWKCHRCLCPFPWWWNKRAR